MRKRTALHTPQALGNILDCILRKYKICVNSEEKRLAEVWNRVVGPQIAEQTRPTKMKKGTLFVNVSTSIWMQQLHYLKQEIMEKFNEHSGKEPIRNIYFSLGEVSPSRTRKEQHTKHLTLETHLLKERERKLIEENVSALEDPELRDLLQRVMTKSLIRKRRAATRKVP